MGIPRWNKEKENAHAQRPWDNAQAGVKALCAAFEENHDSRKALQDFIDTPSNLHTHIGNREVRPLVCSPKPPPLVGLPIPKSDKVEKAVQSSQPPKSLHKPSPSQEMIGIPVEMEVGDILPDRVPSKLPEPASPGMSLEDPELMPRFSYRRSVRQSVRLPSLPDQSAKAARNSRRVDAESLKLLPESASFLEFDDDERLTPLDPEKKAVWKGMSFDEADTFDTFESTNSEEREEKEEAEEEEIEEADGEGPRPESNESEKPLFPAMSFTRKSGGALPLKRVDEDDDGGLDVPRRLTRRPGAEGALRDLQRASITAGQEIQNSLRTMEKGEEKKRVSKVQGDLLLRSRIFRRWNLRYASIVQQGYFGAVLLLFRPEGRGVASGLALKSSKMIALEESVVKKVDGKRPDLFMFELKTSQRTYTFACNDNDGREFWVRHLSNPPSSMG